MEYIAGVDIGGTFTDCVVMGEDGTVNLGKALSTPDDFSRGALNAVRDAAANIGFKDETQLLGSARLFFHACTVGDNALITRSGAKTALLATKGFGDTLLMMRGRTMDGLTEEESYHVSALSKPEPIVPKSFICEVAGRIDYKGAVLSRLDLGEAEEKIRGLATRGVESIAISLLWSISNNVHEKALRQLIERDYPAIYVSASSEVAPFLGEYERTATAAFNAYIGPKISAYLKKLAAGLRERGLKSEPLIMQSYGGVLGIDDTCKNAVGTIESGPASGVVGSRLIGERIGVQNILATDMGGTTFKVSVIRDGNVEKDHKPTVIRYQIFLTKIWVESIGAGGGSIAWIDPESGHLKVGPGGAGADPGPVCYGVGGIEPTVSDADLILGYLNEDYFLGGKMKLYKDKASKAIDEKIARPLGMTLVEAASGIYQIINSHMSDLIRKATVERGYDPADFTLFAFGGAGPVHAGRYAAELGVKQVVIPLTASVHGATGLVSSDVVYEYGKSDHLLVPAEPQRVNAIFSSLVSRALADLRRAGFRDEDITIIRSLDMRYRYQVHELNVPLKPGVPEISPEEMESSYAGFDELYEATYGPGSGYRQAGKEIMAFRVVGTGRLNKPSMKSYPLSKEDPNNSVKGSRKVYFQEQGDFVPTRIYDFDTMKPGMEIAGPAIVETPVTTIVVNPNDRVAVDPFFNLRIHIGS
ncbi:MAG: hydantoinase/oxoprolinase family protein [Candidatus Binatia bacterium]